MENQQLLKIYKNIIEPRMSIYKPLQENVCLKCAKLDEKKINPYGLDTGVCDKCGEINELINEFIYYSVLELKFDIKKEFHSSGIPRIWRENK